MRVAAHDHRTRCTGVRHESGDTDSAEQRGSTRDRAGVHAARTSKSDVAYIPAHVLVVVARQGRARKVIAQLMGHANVDTTLNVYTQVLDGSVREAVEKVGRRLPVCASDSSVLRQSECAETRGSRSASTGNAKHTATLRTNATKRAGAARA